MLDDLAKRVLLAAATKNGSVHFFDNGNQTEIAASDLSISTTEPREMADHRHCIEQLQSNRFIETRTRYLFDVTKKGFDYADTLKANHQ